MQIKIENALDEMMNNFEQKVPEFGSFPKIVVVSENTDKSLPHIGKVELVLRDATRTGAKPSNERAFEVVAHTPSGRSSASYVYGLGTKQALSRSLSSAKTKPNVETILRKHLNRQLEDMG